MPRKESTKDKKCGKCGAPVHPGNNPGWYTREGLAGMIGANFAALSSVNDVSVGGTKLRTNVGVQFRTLIGCPSDTNSSFMKMMSQMYAEIREKNSGAANYSPRILGAYVHDLMTLRALYTHACRMVAAVRSTQVGSADSPYFLAGVAGPFQYSDISKNLANYANALRLIGKDMSVLPIPHIAMFEREDFLYGRIFADSRTAKAAMMAFVPTEYITRVNMTSEGANDWSVVQHTVPTTFNVLISNMQEMLMKLSSNDVIAILRGDLIKAYGYVGMDMSTMVDKPLTVEYNRTVLSQIENSNILFSTVTVTEKKGGSTPTGEVIVTASAQPSIPQRCVDSEWMINFHDDMTPDSGTLLSITRNMSYVNDNKLMSSGDPILSVFVLTGVNAVTQSVSYSDIKTIIGNIDSTTQLTAENALRELSNLCSLVDGMPWFWTGHDTERSKYAYIWDVDQWALVTRGQLEQMNEQCIRSLFYYRAPRVDGMIKPGRL